MGEAKKIIEGRLHPVGARRVLPEVPDQGELAPSADQRTLLFATIRYQTCEGTHARDLRLNIKDGNRVAADVELISDARGNQRRSASQPPTEPNAQAKAAVNADNINRHVVGMAGIVLQRPGEEPFAVVHMPKR